MIAIVADDCRNEDNWWHQWDVTLTVVHVVDGMVDVVDVVGDIVLVEEVVEGSEVCFVVGDYENGIAGNGDVILRRRSRVEAKQNKGRNDCYEQSKYECRDVVELKTGQTLLLFLLLPLLLLLLFLQYPSPPDQLAWQTSRSAPLSCDGAPRLCA